MNEDILDDIDLTNKEKPNYTHFVVSIILLMGAIISFSIQYPIFDLFNLISFSLLILTSILFFRKKELWSKLLAIELIIFTIFIGLFPFPIHLSFSLVLGFLDIGIDFMMLAFLVIHYLQNKNFLEKHWRSKTIEDYQSINSSHRAQVEGFKRRLKRKSSAELNDILKERALIPTALIAVELILEERNAIENPEKGQP